jgi:hypothetical protein
MRYARVNVYNSVNQCDNGFKDIMKRYPIDFEQLRRDREEWEREK